MAPQNQNQEACSDKVQRVRENETYNIWQNRNHDFPNKKTKLSSRLHVLFGFNGVLIWDGKTRCEGADLDDSQVCMTFRFACLVATPYEQPEGRILEEIHIAHLLTRVRHLGGAMTGFDAAAFLSKCRSCRFERHGNIKHWVPPCCIIDQSNPQPFRLPPSTMSAHLPPKNFIFSLRSCRSSSVIFCDFGEGNLAGILRDCFFRTHKSKAQNFRGKFRSIFREKTCDSKKIFRANFVLRTCHTNFLLSEQQPCDGPTPWMTDALFRATETSDLCLKWNTMPKHMVFSFDLVLSVSHLDGWLKSPIANR